ncbi:MAG: recombinase family protein [Defluviitaleaceae bacterium]|nr:recombinase family protein [Defluviitaleaceae bacterium]
MPASYRNGKPRHSGGAHIFGKVKRQEHSPTGHFMLTVFAAVAELEREHIWERQAEGIAAAKAQGKHLGRPVKRCPENFAAVVKNWERGGINFNEALKQTGLKESTFYNRLREMRGGKK